MGRILIGQKSWPWMFEQNNGIKSSRRLFRSLFNDWWFCPWNFVWKGKLRKEWRQWSVIQLCRCLLGLDDQWVLVVTSKLTRLLKRFSCIVGLSTSWGGMKTMTGQTEFVWEQKTYHKCICLCHKSMCLCHKCICLCHKSMWGAKIWEVKINLPVWQEALISSSRFSPFKTWRRVKYRHPLWQANQFSFLVNDSANISSQYDEQSRWFFLLVSSWDEAFSETFLCDSLDPDTIEIRRKTMINFILKEFTLSSIPPQYLFNTSSIPPQYL